MSSRSMIPYIRKKNASIFARSSARRRLCHRNGSPWLPRSRARFLGHGNPGRIIKLFGGEVSWLVLPVYRTRALDYVSSPMVEEINHLRFVERHHSPTAQLEYIPTQLPPLRNQFLALSEDIAIVVAPKEMLLHAENAGKLQVPVEEAVLLAQALNLGDRARRDRGGFYPLRTVE